MKLTDWAKLWGMRLTKAEKQDMENEERMEKTGFWGKAAAGCLPVAVDTKRFLFALRSPFVEEPGTWALWGGAIDGKESPLKAALREFKEEAWYTGKILRTYKLSVYAHESGFKYYTYLLFVPTEFKPHLNHETDDHRWVKYGEWPRPLHPKLKITLNGFKVDSILQELTAAAPKDFLYEPKLRPPTYGGMPPKVQWEFVAISHDLAHMRRDLPTAKNRHGVVKTNRELTKEEIEHFDLTPVSSIETI